MMTAVEGMHGGLSSLADSLQVDRIGPMHQAGSDSLLTAQTFFALVKKHFHGTIDEAK
jgi:CCR4-NOT transcription complex subunit 7/8